MDSKSGIYRILDVNRNRATEALRVIEEYARFILEDSVLSGTCKKLRHSLQQAFLEEGLSNLTKYRDSQSDVGRPGHAIHGAMPRHNLADLLAANLSRARESSRALEEYTRVLSLNLAKKLEVLRYDIYQLEKSVLTKQQTAKTRAHLTQAKLCLLLTPSATRPSIKEMAKSALSGGCRFFQLRAKDLPHSTLWHEAQELEKLCQDHDALLVINDNVAVAANLGKAGVHLGQDDLPPKCARSLLPPNAIVGRSIHDLDELRDSLTEDLDYIGVGTIFSSPTKPKLPAKGLALLREIAPLSPWPIFAIGGISANNAAQAIEAGASGVAVTGSILDAPCIEKATRELLNRVQTACTKDP